MNKTIKSILLLFLAFFSQVARANNEPDILVLKLCGMEQPVLFYFDSKPNVEMGKDGVLVYNENTLISKYLYTEVESISFIRPEVKLSNLNPVDRNEDPTYDTVVVGDEKPDPSGIDKNIHSEGMLFSFRNGVISVDGLKGGSDVFLYGVDGKLLQHVKASEDLNVKIPLAGYQPGVYIIKIGSHTYKIRKK